MDDSLTTEAAETEGSDAVAAIAASSHAPSAGRKVYVRTFGCQMNVYDSERMTEALAAQGYAETGAIEQADLVILNTCHIREKAVEKVYSDLGRIRDVKDERAAAGNDTVIAVVGCVAQAEGAEIVRRCAGRRPRHRPAELSSTARAYRPHARRRALAGRDGVPRRREVRASAAARPDACRARHSSPCRKAATSSARSASCPIRAAWNIRAASPTSSARRARLSPAACAR